MPFKGCYLVVIEGPDKVGKETQSKMLATALPKEFSYTFNGQEYKPERPIKVEREQIPYDDKNTHRKIYQMLASGDAVKYPEAFQTIQAINRMIWQTNVLPAFARHHHVLILDRWNTSGWAYGRASGLSDEFLSCVLDGIVDPDLVFVFEGSPFHTPEREDDSYEANRGFMEEVRLQYQRWAEENPNIAVRVNAGQPKEVIHRCLIDHCRQRLSFE